MLFEKTLSSNPIYSKIKKRRKSSENINFNLFLDKIADIAVDTSYDDGEIYYPMNKYCSIAQPQRMESYEAIKIEEEDYNNITPSNMYIIEKENINHTQNLDFNTKVKQEEHLEFEKNTKHIEKNYKHECEEKNEVRNFN